MKQEIKPFGRKGCILSGSLPTISPTEDQDVVLPGQVAKRTRGDKQGVCNTLSNEDLEHLNMVRWPKIEYKDDNHLIEIDGALSNDTSTPDKPTLDAPSDPAFDDSDSSGAELQPGTIQTNQPEFGEVGEPEV